ncbi:MAG TPA: hypothetical protein VIL34_07210 [Actinopolymorphaceae bacterium]
MIEGELVCLEEPHRVLAKSLLPLLRLGQHDTARSHHLRGYRMARGNESLQAAIASHIEFCALTGNEARGVEILAEHGTYLEGDVNSWNRMRMLGAGCLLLRRLQAIGHGELPVALPGGRTQSASTLLQRLEADLAASYHAFDKRNGNSAVSTWIRQRTEQEPVLDSLPLGLRNVLPATSSGSVARGGSSPEASRAPSKASTHDLDQLVMHARQLREAGDPKEDQVWAKVAAMVEATGAATDPELQGDLAFWRGLMHGQAQAAKAATEFEAAAEAYGHANLPERVASARAATAVALAVVGQLEQAHETADSVL